ncbi:MAG: hypothetical protein J5925_05970 [Clostridia bacterium]|nr:hypothetical protein [Clostridia bacterium]
MKKFAFFFIAFVMVLSFVACGDGNNEGGSVLGGNSAAVSGSSGASGNPTTIEGIINGAANGETFRPDMLSDEERAQLRRDIEAQGGTVDYAADGSIKIKGADGEGEVTILPDGSIQGIDENGTPYTYNASGSTEWPKTGYAAQVPAPGFKMISSQDEDDGFSAAFTGVTYDEAKAYAAKLKNAGFTVNADELDYKESNMYSYEAENAAGVAVSLFFVQSNESIANCSIMIGESKGGSWDDDDFSWDDDDFSWDEDDFSLDLNDAWPASGYCAKLPKATFGSGFDVDSDEDGTSIIVGGVTAANYRTYVQQLKNAGFIYDSDEDEDEGMVYYEAYDSEGYYAYVAYVESYGAMEIGIDAEPYDEYDEDYDD